MHHSEHSFHKLTPCGYDISILISSKFQFFENKKTENSLEKKWVSLWTLINEIINYEFGKKINDLEKTKLVKIKKNFFKDFFSEFFFDAQVVEKKLYKIN